MWTTILSVVGTLLALGLVIVKYYISGDAAKQAKEEQFKKDEEAKQAQIQKNKEASQASQASESQGLAKEWEAADEALKKLVDEKNKPQS